jgi:hypothetical protein
MNRSWAVIGYGCATAFFGFGAIATALPLLKGQREFTSGGPIWIPVAVCGVMALICGVGFYQALTE